MREWLTTLRMIVYRNRIDESKMKYCLAIKQLAEVRDKRRSIRQTRSEDGLSVDTQLAIQALAFK
jgi:hypothetical protein